MKQLLHIFSFLIILSGLMISCTAKEDGPLTDYPNSHLLLSAEELQEILANEEIILIDAREAKSDSLIPGATFFSASYELTDRDYPVENYLIGPEVFQEKMRNLGLNNDSDVVIYDDGNNLWAARLFYALDYYGFSNARLLNGGLSAWIEAGLPISYQYAVHDPGSFRFDVQEGLMCDFDYIIEASNNPNKIIFDARSAGEFSGDDVRAERGGNIPNAVNLEWSSVLEREGVPKFLPAEEIRVMFESLGITPDKEVIPHCHTNVRGSHAYFTLRLMGYDTVRPYEGSWAEYGNREDAVIQ
jgi:thiosulfate/3-mercaptopyruvate sulfurtransferase